MGHFLGQGGMRRFLRGLKANPNQSAANLVDRDVPSANKDIFFHNGGIRTAASVYGLLGQRVDNKAAGLGVDLPGIKTGSYTGDFNELASAEAGGYDGSGSTTTETNDADAAQAKAMLDEYMTGIEKIGTISGMDGKVNHGITTTNKTSLEGAGQLDSSITAALEKYTNVAQVQTVGGTKITPIGTLDAPEWNKTGTATSSTANAKVTPIGTLNTPEWNKTGTATSSTANAKVTPIGTL